MQHPSRMMGKSYNKLLQVELRHKRELVNHFLTEHGLDGVWLAHRPNFAWYTGGTDNYVAPPAESVKASGNGKPRSLSLVVLRDCTYLLADSRVSSGYLLEAATTFGWKLYSYDWQDAGAEGKLLIRLTANLRIGSDTPHVGFRLVDTELACLSQALLAGEQARYRILCQECASIVEAVARTVVREQPEQQLVDQLTDYCELAGITPLHINIQRDRILHLCYRSVWSGTWGGNHTPTQVLLQLVAARSGLQASVTRMVALGGVTPEAYDVYRATVELAAAYFHLVRPGQVMSDVYTQCIAYCDLSPALHPYQLQLHADVTGYRQSGVTAGIQAGHVFKANQTIDCTVSTGTVSTGGTFIVLPDWNEWLTVTNDWPMTSVVLTGSTYYLPDMLCL
ncbi:MAG: M24 family metallopeptidase [Anaerolineae bacterium]|nr:M24 family metallopeptidase [Anaerolineae bacterium]